MKNLFTLIAIVLTVQCVAQDSIKFDITPAFISEPVMYMTDDSIIYIMGQRVVTDRDYRRYDNWCNEIVPDTLNFVKRGAMYLSTSSSALLPHDTEFDNIITVKDSVFGNFIFHQWYIKKRRCEPTFKGFIDWIKDN